MNEKRAIATLTTNEKFLPCILANAAQLKKLNVDYPYIVLIPKDNEIIKNTLIKNNILYKEIIVEQFQTKESRHLDTINKFKILELIEYDKVMFLDGDIIVYNQKIFDAFNYLQDDFLFTYEERIYGNRQVCGQYWLCRPNLQNYSTIKKIIKDMEKKKTKEQYLEDEMIMEEMKYYFSINSIFDDIFRDNVEHFGGTHKAWRANLTFFPYFKYMFFNNELREEVNLPSCEREMVSYFKL